VAWAIEEKNYTQRRACGLVGMAPRVYRYRSRRPDDVSLRSRLRKLAGERRRFGYRRLHLVLKRQGVAINWKKLYRLYREERRIDYNLNRPQTSLEGFTPYEFANRFRKDHNVNRANL